MAILDYSNRIQKSLHDPGIKLLIKETHAKAAIELVEYFRNSAKFILSLIPEPVHLKKLNKRLTSFYENLPPQFSTRKALTVGEELGICERNVYYYLKTHYFKQVKQSLYKKVFKEM